MTTVYSQHMIPHAGGEAHTSSSQGKPTRRAESLLALRRPCLLNANSSWKGYLQLFGLYSRPLNRLVPPIRLVLLLPTLLLSTTPAWAETTMTISFVNSGPEIGRLAIGDLVCNEIRLGPKHFASNDGETVGHFCVRDAATLTTDISITYDGVEQEAYPFDSGSAICSV